MNAITHKAAFQRMTRARSIMVQDLKLAFYGGLALRLELKEMREIDTMATDGTCLAYNPEFVMDQSEPELIADIVHEVKHVALAHHARRGLREPKAWNFAADFAINPEIIAHGYKLQSWVLNEARFANMSPEEIYGIRAREQDAAQLAKKPAPDSGKGAPGNPGAGNPSEASSGDAGTPSAGAGQQPGKPGNDPAQGNGAGAAGKGSGAGKPEPLPGKAANGQDGAVIGEVMDAGTLSGKKGPLSEAEAAAEIDRWRVIVHQEAAIAARRAGTMPGEALRVMAELAAPVIDYREVFAAFIDSMVAVDTSFNRPNRRFLSSGFALPGNVRDAIAHLVFVVDTSSSMNDRICSACGNEVKGAFEDGRVERLTVLFADARVCHVQEFELGDDIKLRPCGGGGTDFRDSFARIERDYSDATAIVYLTDLEVTEFGIEPDCPVLWATFGPSNRFDKLSAKVPFGDAVYIGNP